MTAEMDRIMKRMKDMGVTISVTPAAGAREGFENRPTGIIAESAKKHGIYEDSTNTKENN